MGIYANFSKFSTKVKNGIGHWFTCITNLVVEPTNNIAERALRELIVQRKIIGGLRREKGAKIMEIVSSIITTLRKIIYICFKLSNLIFRQLADT